MPAEQGQNDDHHDGDQNENQSVLDKTLTLFAREYSIVDYSLMVIN